MKKDIFIIVAILVMLWLVARQNYVAGANDMLNQMNTALKDKCFNCHCQFFSKI